MKILIAGDYVPTGRFAKCPNECFYDFSIVDSINKEVDFSLLNLEAPVVFGEAKQIKKRGPNLKVSRDSINNIKKMGFCAVTLANNHFRDYGQIGVDNTLSELKNVGLEYLGGGSNLNEARKILVKRIGSETISFVNFCENEFSIATETRGGSMPMDICLNYHQIKEAKKQSDFVVVIVHGGHEGYQLPSPRMKNLYRLYIELGADVIVNHHQHCYSGFEIYQGKPIFYGLGNFIFDRDGTRHNIWNYGFMVKLELTANRIDYTLIPYEQCNTKPGLFLLSENENEAFHKRIKELSEIIADDKALKSQFEDFLNKMKRGVLSSLGPLTNRYLMALATRGYIPSFLHSKKSAIMYNYINCESHRDVVLNVLKEYFNY